MLRSLFVACALLTLAPRAAHAADLKAGDAAPSFSVMGDDGKKYTLSELRGRYVVLYFYPRDNTPGCTVEARHFRDDSAQYTARGALVLGVSMDDAGSHQAFRAKEKLNFPLLVGTSELAKAYGVPVTFGYASRQTFVIGKDGKLLKVFRSVDVDNHSAEILNLLK